MNIINTCIAINIIYLDSMKKNCCLSEKTTAVLDYITVNNSDI